MKKILLLVSIVAIIIIASLNSKGILKLFYKTKYSEYVEKYATEYNVDRLLIYAIIKAESNFDDRATSNRGACGLMQLMDGTAREVANNEVIEYQTEDALYNPEKNIMIGTKYYADLKQKFGNDEVALAAYNAGSGNVQNWIQQKIIKADGTDIENIPFKETNTYVRKILRDYKIYKRLYLWYRNKNYNWHINMPQLWKRKYQ